MAGTAIEVEGLHYRYGNREALRGVDLAVPSGSITALLGPNGAGKTTLLRTLMGMLRPAAGRVEVLGTRLANGYPSPQLKARIGYVPQNTALYESATVLDLVALCRGLRPNWDDAAVKRYLDLFGLPPNVRVRQLSLGMRAQVALTLVMGGRPELLILDEPTLGLDPLHRHQYMQVLLADSMEAGITVLLSSHDLHQVERLAERIAILNQGRVLVSAPLDDLKVSERRVRLLGALPESALTALPAVRRAVRETNGWLLYTHGEPEDVLAQLNRLPGVEALQMYEESLEEIFLSYVGG